MGITVIAVSIVLSSSPIQIEVQVPHTTFRAGEVVRVELSARNISQEPVVLAKAIWDGAPAASARGILSSGGKELTFDGKSSLPLVQVMVSDRVDKSRFVTIQPSQSVVLYWTEIEQVYDFGSSTTRMKADYARATKHKLKPGKYKFTASYSFDRDAMAKSMKREWNRQISFEPGAEKLWKSALVLNISGTKQFEVK